MSKKYYNLFKFDVDRLLAIHKMIDDRDLPDMTPVLVDANIKSFVSQLCCTVNPVAIIYKKIVCQRCFELLRASYIYPEWDLGWDLGGGSDKQS